MCIGGIFHQTSLRVTISFRRTDCFLYFGNESYWLRWYRDDHFDTLI